MKKPFKVLSAAAMAAVVVVPSIVVPVQAAAATPAAATAPEQLVFTNDAGQQFLVSYEDYADFLFGEGNFVGVLEGKAPNAIAINGKYVDYQKFQDLLFDEENAGLSTSVLLDKAVANDSNLVDKETSDKYVDVTFDKDGEPVYGEPEPTEVEVALEKATTAVTALPNVDDVKATDEAAVTAAAKLVADAKALGADVTALEAKVTALQAKIAEMTATVSVESVMAINAKTLEVKFNKDVDASKAKFEVKRGNIEVAVTAKFASDNKSVELASAANLVAGDYTVKVTGLDFAEGKDTATVKVAAEKTTAVEILDTKVEFGKDASPVSFNVTNQYGEVVNVTADKFNWTAYNTTQNVPTLLNGAVAGLTLDTNEAAASANVVKEGDKIVLTGVLKTDSTVQTSTTLTVTKIVASELTLEQPVLPENAERLLQNAGYVEVPYSLVDSEGTAIKFPETAEVAADQFNVNGVAFTTQNTDIVTHLKVDAKGKLWAKIADKGGDVTLTGLVVSTGKVAVLSFKVNENAYNDTIALGTPEAQLTANGPVVKVPLTVTDQYGATVAPAKVKAADFVVSVSNPAVVDAGAGNTKISADGKYLEVTPLAEGTASVTVTSVKSGKSATTSVDVKKAAAPTDIAASASSTNVLKGATFQVKGEVLNQYGGGITGTLPGAHKVVIKGATAADAAAITVLGSGASFTDVTTGTDFKKDGYGVTVKADANVSSVKLNVELQDTNGVVVATKVLTVNVAGETSALTYSIEPVAKLSGLGAGAPNSEYAKELKLVAKDSSGNEITIPYSKVKDATSENPALVDVALNSKGKYAVSGLTAGITGTDVTEKSTTVRLLVEDTDGSVKTVAVEVTVSKDALKPVAIKAVEDADAKKEVSTFTIADVALSTGGTSDELATGIIVAGTGAVDGNFNFVVEDQFGGKSLAPVTYTVTGVKGFTFADGEEVKVDTTGAAATLQITKGSDANVDTRWTKDAELIVTASTANGLTKSVKITFGAQSETVAPGLTTALPAKAPVVANATPALVFSEALNAASQAAVKAAVDAAYTKNGTATVSSAWNTAGTTLTVTITAAASPNDVTVGTIAPIFVTDLAGNKSVAALAIQTP